MPAPVILALTLMAGFMIKHAIADYGLQTAYMFHNKGRYFHPGGILHAGLHVLLSVPVLMLLPPPTMMAMAAILGGEFLVHYHVDWVKERINRDRDLQPDCARFWRLHGLDQLLHGLTYVAMAAALFAVQTT